jgi:hypothetical protein
MIRPRGGSAQECGQSCPPERAHVMASPHFDPGLGLAGFGKKHWSARNIRALRPRHRGGSGLPEARPDGKLGRAWCQWHFPDRRVPGSDSGERKGRPGCDAQPGGAQLGLDSARWPTLFLCSARRVPGSERCLCSTPCHPPGLCLGISSSPGPGFAGCPATAWLTIHRPPWHKLLAGSRLRRLPRSLLRHPAVAYIFRRYCPPTS